MSAYCLVPFGRNSAIVHYGHVEAPFRAQAGGVFHCGNVSLLNCARLVLTGHVEASFRAQAGGVSLCGRQIWTHTGAIRGFVTFGGSTHSWQTDFY